MLRKETNKFFSYQDYSARPTIDGVVLTDISRFSDCGGGFSEVVRLNADGGVVGQEWFRPQQINISTIEPEVIRAFHIHPSQWDCFFVPPEVRLLMVLGDERSGSDTEGTIMRFMMGDHRSRLLFIPPGVAHGFTNLGRQTAHVFYLVTRFFDAANSEEGRLPWDFYGRQIWEPVKG